MPLSSTTLIAQNRFETIFIFTYLLCGRGWVEGGLLCCVFAFTLRTCDCCFSPTERTKTDWAAEIKRRRSHFEKLPAAIRFRFRPVRSWAFKRSCELISEASGAFANRSAEARWSEWRDACQREMERKSGRAGGDTLASGSSRVDREVFEPNIRTTYNPYLPWKRSGKRSTFYFKQITTLSSNLHYFNGYTLARNSRKNYPRLTAVS